MRDQAWQTPSSDGGYKKVSVLCVVRRLTKGGKGIHVYMHTYIDDVLCVLVDAFTN